MADIGHCGHREHDFEGCPAVNEETLMMDWSTQAWLNLAAILDDGGRPDTATIDAFLAQAPPQIRDTAIKVRLDALRGATEQAPLPGDPNVDDLVDAIRLTQEYAQLPAISGWSWYDALARHAPDVAAQLRADWERSQQAAPSTTVQWVDAPGPMPIDRIAIDGHVIHGTEFEMGSLRHDVDHGTVALTFCDVRVLEILYAHMLNGEPR